MWWLPNTTNSIFPKFFTSSTATYCLGARNRYFDYCRLRETGRFLPSIHIKYSINLSGDLFLGVRIKEMSSFGQSIGSGVRCSQISPTSIALKAPPHPFCRLTAQFKIVKFKLSSDTRKQDQNKKNPWIHQSIKFCLYFHRTELCEKSMSSSVHELELRLLQLLFELFFENDRN